MKTTKLEVVMPGLHASIPEPLPFDNSLEIRPFVLKREQGNLAVYNSTTVTPDLPDVRNIGGIARRYFNHWHEAMIRSVPVDVPLYCHAVDFH